MVDTGDICVDFIAMPSEQGQSIQENEKGMADYLSINSANKEEDGEFDFDDSFCPGSQREIILTPIHVYDTRYPELGNENHQTTELTSPYSPVASPQERDVPDNAECQNAEDEWKNMEAVIPGVDHGVESSPRSPVLTVAPLLTYEEFFAFLLAQNLDQYKSHIKPTVQQSACSAILRPLLGPPRLNRELHAERERVFLTAACPLDDENIYLRALQTIYRHLTGARFDCPRNGAHWEHIGFQGSEPATDLRSAGVLSLLQLLYLTKGPKLVQLAKNMYHVAQHETQNFPFCVMSINMTKLAMEALREEKLNKLCNSQKQVFEVFNLFYAACFFYLYTIWKKENKTIADSGFVLQEVERRCKKRPAVVIAELEAYLNQDSIPFPKNKDAAKLSTISSA